MHHPFGQREMLPLLLCTGPFPGELCGVAEQFAPEPGPCFLRCCVIHFFKNTGYGKDKRRLKIPEICDDRFEIIGKAQRNSVAEAEILHKPRKYMRKRQEQQQA